MKVKVTSEYLKFTYLRTKGYFKLYVMQLGSGEDPELQNTLKNASYRGGRAAN